MAVFGIVKIIAAPVFRSELSVNPPSTVAFVLSVTVDVALILRFWKVVEVVPPMTCGELPLKVMVSVPCEYVPLFVQLPLTVKFLFEGFARVVPLLIVTELKL